VDYKHHGASSLFTNRLGGLREQGRVLIGPRQHPGAIEEAGRARPPQSAPKRHASAGRRRGKLGKEQ
jgi:hypothetical protein